MKWSLVPIAVKENLVGGVASKNGVRDLPLAEKAALLSKAVWLVYQQIAKLAGVVGKTGKVEM